MEAQRKAGRRATVQELQPELRDMRLLISSFNHELGKSLERQKATDQAVAQRFEQLFDHLETLATRTDNQILVRLDRQHKELLKRLATLEQRVEALTAAAEGAALNSDTYSAQAAGELRNLKREVRDLAAQLTPESDARAVGEEPTALARYQTAA